MNLTDLTEVLRDHAELDDTAHDARMAGIRARVLGTRRRLALTGVVCVVLALVGTVFLALPRQVQPAEPARSFPEYGSGSRLVMQAWRDLSTDSVTVEYTPKSDSFVLFERCVAESANQVLVNMITINGREVKGGGCDGGGVMEIGDLAKYGGAVGKPLVITMIVGFGRVEGEPPEKVEDVRSPDESATGEFAIGIGELVPISEYSFPPRPETLEDLDDIAAPGDINIRADRNDPDAPQTLNVTWSGPYRLLVSLNTPGRIEVLVNGKVISDVDSWDYGVMTGFGNVGDDDELRLSPGQTATITVIPERTTGDWIVQLAEIN
jgi:hypothetical protein